MADSKNTLIMLKPDALLAGLDNSFEVYLRDYGLEIVGSREILLTKRQVLKYQKAFHQSDPIRGDDWKEAALALLTSSVSKIYLLQGSQAIAKGIQLKKAFRKKFMDSEKAYDSYSKSIYNLIHCVDDKEDLILNLQVLAPDWLEKY